MECPLCGHYKSHKHGKTSIRNQRYYCPVGQQTFTETFDTLHYRRQIQPEQMRMVPGLHVEGSSLRGISRTVNLAYNTVVSLVRAASQKGQMIHNAHVENIETSQISSDEFWSFVQKKKTKTLSDE